MKRFLLIALLAAALAGCNIIIQTPTPALKVLSATYNTSFSAPDGQSAICDNKVTQLTYTFRYEGQLQSWSSYLKGQTLGKVSAVRTFTPGSAGVSAYQTNGYEVTYNLPTDFTPYRANPDSSLSAQAIIVTPVPPLTPIGATKLYVTLTGADGNAQPYVSKDIPVYINCP